MWSVIRRAQQGGVRRVSTARRISFLTGRTGGRREEERTRGGRGEGEGTHGGGDPSRDGVLMAV